MRIWNPWSKPKEAPPTPSETSPSPQLLEDRPPKFEHDPNKILPHEQQAQLFKHTITSLGSEDFKNIHKVPCLRRAILTGGGIAGVTFGVLVTAKQPYLRGSNWAMMGFLMGSVTSWEQCRYTMRKSRRNAEEARKILREKGKRTEPSVES